MVVQEVLTFRRQQRTHQLLGMQFKLQILADINPEFANTAFKAIDLVDMLSGDSYLELKLLFSDEPV